MRETERCLRKRVKEHSYQGTKSEFEEHCKRHTYSIIRAGKVKISESQVAVLYQELEWFKIGVAASIYIMQEETTLNRDKGRLTLLEIFWELLTSDHHGHFESQHYNGGHQST